MTNAQWVQFIFTALAFAATVAVAAVYIRSSVSKALHKETAELAEVRAKTIAEMQVQLTEMGDKISRLEALVQATSEVKVQAIVDGVVNHPEQRKRNTELAEAIVRRMKTAYYPPEGSPA